MVYKGFFFWHVFFLKASDPLCDQPLFIAIRTSKGMAADKEFLLPSDRDCLLQDT